MLGGMFSQQNDKKKFSWHEREWMLFDNNHRRAIKVSNINSLKTFFKTCSKIFAQLSTTKAQHNKSTKCTKPCHSPDFGTSTSPNFDVIRVSILRLHWTALISTWRSIVLNILLRSGFLGARRQCQRPCQSHSSWWKTLVQLSRLFSFPLIILTHFVAMYSTKWR